MKKIWFNSPILAELLTDNGIELICDDGMNIIISDENAEKVEQVIKTLAPAAINDYGFEELD